MIDPERLRPDFDRLWPKLERAMLTNARTHRKEDVWADIEQGRAQFWIGRDSAVVTEIVINPTGLQEVRGWLAGGDLDELKRMESVICAWAKHQGCERFVITGRRGWQKKLPGYREKAVFLAKEL